MLRYKNINLDNDFMIFGYSNENEIFNDLAYITNDYEKAWDKAKDHYVNIDVAIDNLINYVHNKCEYYYDKVDNYDKYTDRQYYYHKAQLKKHATNYVILKQMLRFYE